MPSHESAPPLDRIAGGRLGRIVGAYALAAVGAALVRTLGLVIEEGLLRGFGPMIDANGYAALLGVPLASIVVVFVAGAPFTTAFVVFAESRSLRVSGPYLAAGAVIGVLTQAALGVLVASASPASPGLYALAAVSGLFAGWLYWMVAVRAAPPPPPSRLPHSLDPRF